MNLDAFLDRWKAVPVRTRGLALIVVITLLLVGMAAHEQYRRMSGREVIVTAEPVDPRDLLRGAYVALDYQIERVNISELAQPPDFDALWRADSVYLVLHQDSTRGWQVIRVLTAWPPPTNEDNYDVVVKAKFKKSGRPEDRPSTLAFDIGADRYFADEATAKTLGNTLRDKTFDVVLSVGGDGHAVIKGLVLNGARRDEGFF